MMRMGEELATIRPYRAEMKPRGSGVCSVTHCRLHHCVLIFLMSDKQSKYSQLSLTPSFENLSDAFNIAQTLRIFIETRILRKPLFLHMAYSGLRMIDLRTRIARAYEQCSPERFSPERCSQRKHVSNMIFALHKCRYG
uniref:Uncharacterized protein n=1 Tax=Angiostrongylus cantonensis TaxID=6313 RepID=A0A0K0CUB2_ANGCA